MDSGDSFKVFLKKELESRYRAILLVISKIVFYIASFLLKDCSVEDEKFIHKFMVLVYISKTVSEFFLVRHSALIPCLR